MNRLKSFFVGVLLLTIMSVALVLVTLVYTANDRSSIKSYMFQLEDYSNQRAGALRNIKDMTAIELRNKLIKKYVSEYFAVFPNDTDVLNRPTLRNMSDPLNPRAYSQWQNGEAQTIKKMSENKMFRRVLTDSIDIVTKNMPENYSYYTNERAQEILYEVHYYTETWAESNKMGTKPVYERGVIYLQARFKPGIKEHIVYNNEEISIRDYLESGKDPVGLFMFEVVNVGSKGIE